MHNWPYRRPDSARIAYRPQVSVYIDDIDNVIDFTERYVMHMAKLAGNCGREDLAEDLYAALDRYIAGEVGIRLINGDVFLVPLDIIEEYEEASVDDT